MELGGNRLGKFSLTTRRVFVCCALVPSVVTVANHYLGWGLFGVDDRLSIAISFVVLFLVMRYLGPTVHQLREYREGGRSGGRSSGT
jgi:hypothetical protein